MFADFRPVYYVDTRAVRQSGIDNRVTVGEWPFDAFGHFYDELIDLVRCPEFYGRFQPFEYLVLNEYRPHAITGDILDILVIEKWFENSHLDFIAYEKVFDGLVFLLCNDDLSFGGGGDGRKSCLLLFFFLRKIGTEKGADFIFYSFFFGCIRGLLCVLYR